MGAPFSFANLVHESATTTGTGNFTLAQIGGKQTFDNAFGHGATTDAFEYFISNQGANEWEHGTGHMSDATTLVRDTVWDSSNSGSAVGFSAGTKDVTAAVSALQFGWRGYIDGMILPNDAGTPNTKIDVAAGICRDDTDAMMVRLAVSKVVDCATTGANGLDTGSLAASTWYHVYAIGKRDGSAQAALASTSASSPAMPSGYQYKRRIGSFKTDGSSHIIAFVQTGDVFRWSTPVQDVNANNPGTSAVTRTLTLPTGVKVQADMVIGAENTAGSTTPGSIYISDLSAPDNAASGTVASTFVFANTGHDFLLFGPASVMTNTSAQVRSRLQISDANTNFFINTLGWTDQRGRNA